MQNEADAYRKVRLRVEDVQGKNCLTNFWVSSCAVFSKLPIYRRDAPVNMSDRCILMDWDMKYLCFAHECLLSVGYGLHHRQVEVAGAQVADAH